MKKHSVPKDMPRIFILDLFQNAHFVMAYIKIISHCNRDIYYILEEQSYRLSSVELISKCSFELCC